MLISKFQIKTKVVCTIVLLLVSTVGYLGCNQIDPTQVVNPTITDQSLDQFPEGSATQIFQGVRQYASTTVSAMALYTAFVSDDYINISTFLSPVADDPRKINFQDIGVAVPYNSLQTLRAYTEFAIQRIPNDVLASDATKQRLIAQTRFYRGLALLMLAENYQRIPLTVGDTLSNARAVLSVAIGEFMTARSALTPVAAQPTGTPDATAAILALARAWRAFGNLDSAAIYAAAAIGATNATRYVLQAQFDQNTAANGVQPFVLARGANDMQPLPRLDFLDPKYNLPTSPIPILKIEEAHLILAEVNIIRNNFVAARGNLVNAINAALRPDSVAGFTDADPRVNISGAPPQRPNTASFLCRASATDSAVPGLVRTRRTVSGGTVTTVPIALYPTSFTSLRANNITDTLGGSLASPLNSGSRVAHLRILYQLRQEIFFLEGRRVSDLGIRLPFPIRQLNVNTLIPPGAGTSEAIVPDYIPQFGTGIVGPMDNYSVAGNIVTMSINMNAILAQSNVSPFLQ
jgi:hypothetical protein